MNFRVYTSYFTAVAMIGMRLFSAAKKVRLTPTAMAVKRLGKTPQQQVYLEYLQQANVSMVVAVGCAGTGKTWLACHQAAQSLQDGHVDRIVLTRPIVPVEGEEGLGFLPGSLESKMDPWTRPMVDALRPLLSPTVLQKQVEMIPLMYMRGRTFDHTFVVADEMQNSTPEQMLMLVTRIGNHSRLVVTGDPQQTDRAGPGSKTSNGLSDLVQRIQNNKPALTHIRSVHLTAQDVQRSALVQELLEQVYASPDPQPTKFAETQKRTSPRPRPPPSPSPSPSPSPPPSLDQDCALILDDPYLRRRA